MNGKLAVTLYTFASIFLALGGTCSNQYLFCTEQHLLLLWKGRASGGVLCTWLNFQDIRNSVIFRSSWRGQSSSWLNLTSVHHWKQFSQQLFILCSVAFNPYFWPSCPALHTLLSLGSAMLTMTESETLNKAVNTFVLL